MTNEKKATLDLVRKARTAVENDLTVDSRLRYAAFTKLCQVEYYLLFPDSYARNEAWLNGEKN